MDFFEVLLVLVLSLGWILWRKVFKYWDNLGVYQFPITFPEGNIRGLGKTKHISAFVEEYSTKMKKLGLKFCGIYMYTSPVLLVIDLDLIKDILIKDFNVFTNRGRYINEKDDPLSAHLINIENESWRNLRHKMSPTFTSGKLKMMFGTVCDVADKLITIIDKQLETNGQLDVKDTLARYTTDIIGSAAFGLECNSLEDRNSIFYQMGTRHVQTTSFIMRNFRNNFHNLSRFLGLKLIDEKVSKFYVGITRETVEYREKNPNVNRQDFIKLLVDMKKQNMITFDQIAAQSFIFFLAGFETSASTMTYCMYELSLNEEIQEKVREDVRRALEKHEGKLTYDAIGDMDYLEQCLNETLRKYPVVTLVQRKSIHDYKIPGTDVILPKGQAVSIPVHAIHWDEDNYPNPKVFDPDRFTPEEVAKRHPFAYIPFGGGPRICIGMRFAMLELKIGLAKMLMKYKFSLDKTKTPTLLKMSSSSFLLTAEKKIYVDIEKL